MSTIILVKDHESEKKGTKISVPYVKAKDLIAQGIARYAEQPPPVSAGAPGGSPVPERVKELTAERDAARSDLLEVKKQFDTLAAENRALGKEIDKVKAELETAKKK